jgi:hypothetical protein
MKCDMNNSGTLHEDRYTFSINRLSFLLRVRNVSDEIVEKIETHILWSVTFFFESRSVYEVMWKNVVEWGRPQMTISCVRVACWVPKSTNTHSEYLILIAVPLQ